MKFNVIGLKENKEIEIKPNHVYVVWYSGSNKDKTWEHINELERELGVTPPPHIPTLFEVAREMVTQDKDLFFCGEKTSGECEYIIIKIHGIIYIGLGSDHSDRELEADSVPKAKQICLKPISKEIWLYDDIKDHFKEIELNSKSDNEDYQKGTLADILSVEEIIKELEDRVDTIDNCIIYSGTVPVLSGFKFGKNFYLELVDKKLNRKISFDYNVNNIPDEAR